MKNVKQKVKEFIGILQKEGIPVKKTILFGSYAKGVAKDYSDIDVCVVSDHLGKNYYDELVKLRKLALKIDAKIVPVPFTPQDLEDKYNTLATEIRMYGKLL